MSFRLSGRPINEEDDERRARLAAPRKPRTMSPVACDVSALAPDAVTVDRLARLQLTLRGFGSELTLVNASNELLRLLDLCGLTEILPAFSPLSLEGEREPEQREELLGVQEERDPGDHAV
jgi:hypothetical protein